ncbi:GTP pyrophosphokinase [Filifactor villosus]|uniref:GTP pyrophosphokinase n=1 Tax=Filifactor villosus TaxID=29374 RepID=A0ABV9QP50_9FIRM
MYLKALRIAYRAHRGQKDKAGKPYIFHPIRVSLGVKNREAKIVALLHDVIEDSEITMEELYFLNDRQKQALLLLTHKEEEDYFDYIQRIKNDEIARQVKVSDLRHNADLTRLHTVTERDRKRRRKYLKALSMLEQ